MGTKQARQDLIGFAVTVTRELEKDWTTNLQPLELSGRLTRLCEINDALSTLALAGANVGLTERQEKRQDKLEAEAAKIIKTLGPGFGLSVTQDPRGVPLKVVLPSGRSNSFGGEGWRVPLTR